MAGLMDALGTASRGLQVVQRGIATTGHNIANANTSGYSRQRAVLETSLPIVESSGMIGTGVEQVSVDRIVDEFTQLRLMSETSRRAALDAEAGIYAQVESVVNDQLSEGLTQELTGFFGALDDLHVATEPGQPVERGAVLAAAESLIDTIHRYDAQLRDLQSGADRGITSILPEVNALTSRIAELNGQIAEAETIAPANDLRDRRDELLLELSQKMEFTTLEDQAGMVSVRIGGGIQLVNGRTANELSAVVDPANPNPFDATFSNVYYQGSGAFFDVTSSIKGGELGGLIEARDGIVGGVIRDLDAFAFTLAEGFNAQHRAGFGLVDGAPHDFFVDTGSQPSVDDSARNLALSADIDPAQGGTLGNIAAAAAAGASGADAGDTAHAEVLGNLRDGSVASYLAGDAPGTPTGPSRSLSSSLIDMIGNLGQQARTTTRALEQQEAVLSAVQDRRDSISGVSVDEEVANLVQLQTSFQANARVITTVNQLFTDLMSAF